MVAFLLYQQNHVNLHMKHSLTWPPVGYIPIANFIVVHTEKWLHLYINLYKWKPLTPLSLVLTFVTCEWPGCSIWTHTDAIITPYVLLAQSVFKIVFLFFYSFSLNLYTEQCGSELVGCSLALRRLATIHYILFDMRS